jgi:predicted acetyltransferase
MALVWPCRDYLSSYVAALERGWSPDDIRGAFAIREELSWITRDADEFLSSLVDREGRGGPLTLADGTTVPRLPSVRRWMWDGEFSGSISLRWRPGTETLPAHCLGHIGYTVVPWKQRRGYATRALAGVLAEATALGLRYVELVTDPDNGASQRVIAKNGGVFVEVFRKPPSLGGAAAFRYRIDLPDGPAES